MHLGNALQSETSLSEKQVKSGSMDFKFPLYFEAEDLGEIDKNKVRRHFQKRRDSGGGDCGHVEKTGEKQYRICFMEEEDRERVLQRKNHSISLPSGELCLTVSRTAAPEPAVTEPAITKPTVPESAVIKPAVIKPIVTKPVVTEPVVTEPAVKEPAVTEEIQYAKSAPQIQIKPKPKPRKAPEKPNPLEMTSHMEIYLLYYLRDCPKAFSILKSQFLSIGSVLELDFLAEVLRIKGDAFEGPPEKWHLQVERFLRLFQEAVTCTHVLEARKAELIMQDAGFGDEFVKVYTDLGYPVVVGKERAVKERIKNVDRVLPSRTELSINEKQFKLIEDEFTREMSEDLPSVKVAKGDSVLVLEGLDTDLQLSLAKYESLLTRIQQKVVPFPLELIDFITTSSAIDKYKNCFLLFLKNRVSLEAAISEFVLSSSSSEALEEAEAILKKDFSFEIVQLEGNAAVLLDLAQIKALLKKGQVNVNAHDRRIEVCLVPEANGTAKVQILGYSDTVSQFKEALEDFQQNHVTVEELLPLPSAEIADNFSKILAMLPPKDSKVSIQASSSPCPWLLLSGPQKLVQKTQSELNAELSGLVSETLVLDGPGAGQYFGAEGKASKELIEKSNQVLIQELAEDAKEKAKVEVCPEPVSAPETETRRNSIEPEASLPNREKRAVVKMPLSRIKVNIKLGCLLDEQVNVLVVPMLKKTLSSTRIGKVLEKKGGLKLKMKFSSTPKRSLSPGGVLQLVAPPSLGCSKLFFIECLPWDGVGGQSAQALCSGLQRCLELCGQQGYSSMALPLIGTGTVLKYPLDQAVQLLTDTLKQGAKKAPPTVQSIHIIVKPDEDSSETKYREVHRQLTQNMNQEEQVIFRSVHSDLDSLSVSVGSRTQVQLVFGDITLERTDAVVNSTNFQNFEHTGVCKAILTVAGPEVEAELKSATVSKGEVLLTHPGQFPCKGLLHVCGQRDVVLVQRLMSRIVQYCESYGWTSVAIPAICAGNAGLDPGVVAGAILGGLKDALSLPLQSLVQVRIVLWKICDFLAFKEEATQMFPKAAIQRVKAPPPPPVTPPKPKRAPPVSPPPLPPARSTSLTLSVTSDQPSVFRITGLSQINVSTAMKNMKDLYQSQCSSQTFGKEELATLTQGDLLTLKQSVQSLGLQVKCHEGDWTVSGPTAKVNQVIHLVHTFMYGTLTREVRIKEEEDLYARVAWCLQGPSRGWERLPKAANYQLEHKKTEAGIEDAQGQQWDVQLENMEVTKQFSTLKAPLKRLENLPDFVFPLYWDNMASTEILKVVPLSPSSAEYQAVQEGFQLTCPKTVLKIERVQNIHLRRSYEAQFKCISDKNRASGGANERPLYHGTTRENSTSIMNMGFNRRFSGQNATSYGQGTYFAINASYSAHPTYSKPDPDGTQSVFLAQVLTGLHTQGHKDLRLPPARDALHPHDRFDSVVDNTERPNMFVVFHDNQAYPDYLISFQSAP